MSQNDTIRYISQSHGFNEIAHARLPCCTSILIMIRFRNCRHSARQSTSFRGTMAPRNSVDSVSHDINGEAVRKSDLLSLHCTPILRRQKPTLGYVAVYGRQCPGKTVSKGASLYFFVRLSAVLDRSKAVLRLGLLNIILNWMVRRENIQPFNIVTRWQIFKNKRFRK